MLPKSPKWQKVQVEEKSLNDSISTIKTAMSTKPAKSVLKGLTTTDNFLTKMMQTASLQSKGQKRGGLGTGVEVLETRKNALEIVPVGPRRELVDKVPLCCASLRECTVAPGSGTTTTAASH